MENILVYFLFLTIFNTSIEVVPLFNFQSFAFDLLDNENSFTYTKYSNDLYGIKIQLNRTIYKEDGEIKIKNKLYLENEYYGITKYDDIESYYKNGNNNYLVCPKGKHHIYLYYKGNKTNINIIPNGFPNIDNWDLMCYYQYRHKVLFVAYLGQDVQFYQFNFNGQDFKTSKSIHEGIHAFNWTTNGLYYNENPKIPMFAIIKNGNKYFLDYIIVDVKENEDFGYEESNGMRELTSLKSNYLACFQKETTNFYWINYNNAYDLEIGSYTGNEDFVKTGIYNLNIQTFKKSPLEFLEKITIFELKFIFQMYFAYYIIKNDKDKYYYGIIDVPRNRVIFNTDKEIIKYIPYLDYAMLAITKNSAYKICVSRDENDCHRCSDSQFMIDSSKYNFCGNNCNTKYILKPNNICSDTCDKSIFIIKNNNECGLCRDLGDGNEYKFYNQSGCLKEKPENSIYVNENLKIIDCDNNYKYENGKCILKCHNNCDNCTIYSIDINNQKCTSCKSGLVLQDGNCIEKCSNNYFLNDKICQKCDESCQTCNKV